jgi:hypothetical protein
MVMAGCRLRGETGFYKHFDGREPRDKGFEAERESGQEAILLPGV